MQTFDLIVVGSGPGGYTGAIRAAQLGLKTAIVEKNKNLGGTCLNVGCIPSKALLESSEHYAFAKHSLAKHGVKVQSPQLDLKQMMDRKNKMVSQLAGGVRFLMKKNKISVFNGLGCLKSPTEIEIRSANKTENIEGKYIMLATGSEVLQLPFAKLDAETVVSSTEALSFSKPPKNMTLIGGGYIGLELGSVWSRLGTEVTVMESSPSLCPTMDKELSEGLFSLLKKQGMRFELSARVESVKKIGLKAEIRWKDKEGKAQTTKSDKALICIGRKPCTKGLGLKQLGLSLEPDGRLKVDEHLRSLQENIFAVGDLIHGPMLAHKAEEEGVAVAEFIATGYGHVNYNAIPSVIYTHPPASSVGLTEQELREKNIPFAVGRFPFSANGRAKALGEEEGFVKVLAHKQTDRVLGVHILGPRAGDLIAVAVSAMMFHASAEDMARCCYAHPTLSEAIREACLNVEKRARQM